MDRENRGQRQGEPRNQLSFETSPITGSNSLAFEARFRSKSVCVWKGRLGSVAARRLRVKMAGADEKVVYRTKSCGEKSGSIESAGNGYALGFQALTDYLCCWIAAVRLRATAFCCSGVMREKNGRARVRGPMDSATGIGARLKRRHARC